GQDVGFQEPIDDSPRKRHHIRFWGVSSNHSDEDIASARFWLNTDKPPSDARVLWVGAGTKDIGFSLTRLTFQITHATASDTNEERDHIIRELQGHGVLGDVSLRGSGATFEARKINRYVTDGEIAFAKLAEC